MKTRGVLIVLILSSLLFAQNDSVIISEIMFYPPSGNNEFIELYNLSNQNVNLQDFTIRYYTSLPDSITSAGYGTLLPPGCHAVIMEGDYVIENGIYKNIIPESALILKISNNAFGSNGMANTTSRPVSLYSKEGENINSYYYSADNAQTFSDEKMIFIADTSSSYWTNSLIQNGTPGFRNSVMLYNHNIKVFNLSCVPENPLAGDNIELNVNIKNTGTEDAGLFTVKIYNDFNFDSIPSLSEMIYSEIKSLLHSGDSVSVLYTINNLPAGQYNFIAEAEYPQDEFPSDNISCKNIRILQGTEPNSVIINEIMYAPQDGEPEWIEIYNNTPDNINLKNWGIGDAVSAYYITTDDLLLLSNSYIVLSKDSSVKSFYPFTYDFLEVYLPSLNNTGDAVVLFDSNFVTVDSLYYTPDWGGAGNKSIEKIEPSSSSLSSENWTTCVNMYRATPGFINSVTPKNNDISISSFRTYQEYGIVGEQVNFVLSVKNTGKNITGNFNISVYKDIDSDSIINSSEEIKIFTAGIIVPGDSLIFDFQFAEFNAGDNHFIARIFSNDEDTCNNIAFFSFKGVTVNFGRNDILINEIMHSPEDEPEWLEV
ncbi:MAG: hypothetical protein EHM47_17340, partial [Ignavibacteriales bacterium]